MPSNEFAFDAFVTDDNDNDDEETYKIKCLDDAAIAIDDEY